VDLDELKNSVSTLHRMNARSELNWPSAEGVFPRSFWTRPLPVVPDAMWLRNDIRYACHFGQRTTIVTAANEQFIRPFVAMHVLEEVHEHSREWCEAGPRAVDHDEFIARFSNEYLPLIRAIPHEGVPRSWMCPAEQARLAQLAAVDPDDIPSVMLALAVRGLYLSRDKRALRAAYGDRGNWAAHAEWLTLLQAGGDAGQVVRLFNAVGGVGLLGGYGAAAVARRAYSHLGPLSVAAGAGLVYGGVKWFRHPSRQGLRTTLGQMLEFFGGLAALLESQQQLFDQALPPSATWDVRTDSRQDDAVVGRGALYALSRDEQGHRSAHELAEKLRTRVGCTEAQVRGLLRATGCFEQVYRGRWQAGTALVRSNRTE
jgi:predicted nucleic acid-binding protein